MPIYEYYCPQCQNKFETMKAMSQRHRARCPHCNSESKIVPSVFAIYDLNWTQKDGEGFTTRDVPLGELKEMNQETRER